MELTAIDLRDEHSLLAAFALETRVTQEMKGPSWAPLPARVRLERWTNQPGFSFTLLAAWDDTRMVGLGERCVWVRDPDDFFVLIHVDAQYRRRGLGTELLHAVESGAGPQARRFVSEPFFTRREDLTELRDGFAAANGYMLGATELTLEATLAADSVPRADPAPGWHVETYVDGIPDELLPQVGVIQGLVDEQAPSGDVEWMAHTVTPEEYHADLAQVRAEGSHLIEALAMSPDGHVAGWTAITTSPAPDRPARVPGTLVLDKFRGHGLGMALKSAVAHQAAQLGVTRIATESNEDNAWMLDINHRQGFQATGLRATFHKNTAQ